MSIHDHTLMVIEVTVGEGGNVIVVLSTALQGRYMVGSVSQGDVLANVVQKMVADTAGRLQEAALELSKRVGGKVVLR